MRKIADAEPRRANTPRKTRRFQQIQRSADRGVMDGNTVQSDTSVGARTPNAFIRGFIRGAAGLLDIFRVKASPGGTPEDDALELAGDVKEVAQDFYAVLPNIEVAAKK